MHFYINSAIVLLLPENSDHDDQRLTTNSTFRMCQKTFVPGSSKGIVSGRRSNRDYPRKFSRDLSTLQTVVMEDKCGLKFIQWKFRLKFQWILFKKVQLTIFKHWFGWWIGAVQALSHYLNQWWLVYRCIYALLDLNELNLGLAPNT